MIRRMEAPAEVRAAVRRGDWTGPTAGLAPEFTQANLVVLPEADAFDFLRFCVRNPKPCPVLEVCDPGSPEPGELAPGADLRTDLPRYRVWRHGEPAGEATDVRGEWREDLVAFLIGCSFTFERALQDAGLPVRHVPGELGIEDLGVPDYGDPVELRDGEIPVFWACGVTPQAVAVASRPELMITHAPGHMFVSDQRDRPDR